MDGYKFIKNGPDKKKELKWGRAFKLVEKHAGTPTKKGI